VTFSIVAWDPSAEPAPEWGVAVASKFLAVGAAVPWARAGAGAVATQALANLAYGPGGLDLLASGATADDVVARLTAADDERAHRQLGVVDSRGRAATYTGSECFDWAGGRTGEGYCCQGNILTGPDVVDEMCSSFEGTTGDLTERLMAALTAGDARGGDRRGRQSASILVVREGGGYGGGIDAAVDLRVDDDSEPVAELARILEIHRLLFPSPSDLDFIDIDDRIASEIATLLKAEGYEVGPESGYSAAIRRALFEFVGTENLEERWTEDARIEAKVLGYLRSRADVSDRSVR
jgi:uncharacterized Ntn-hydrolase superfamily protein